MKKERNASKMKVQPLADRVLIKEIPEIEGEVKTKSGIIIPPTVQEDKGAKRGTVVAVGKGRFDDGKLVPLEVSVGDTVLYQWGDKIKIDGEEYFIVRENEITAIIR
jgi:chaperonin GroES